MFIFFLLWLVNLTLGLEKLDFEKFYDIIQKDYKEYYGQYCQYPASYYLPQKSNYVEGYGGAGGNLQSVSMTNIQKEGVDESDIIKVGNYIVYYSTTKNKVYIVDPKKFEVLRSIKIIEGSYNISLYNYENDILILGERYINKNLIYVLRYDIKGNLKSAYFLKGQGYDVRLLKNKLYLVSQYYIYYDCYYPFNRKDIKYLSKLYIYDGLIKTINLNEVNLLYSNNEYGYNLKYVYEINLNENNINTRIFLTKGSISNIHMTKENLYIINGYYENNTCIGIRCSPVLAGKYMTNIVKIKLDGLLFLGETKINGNPLDQYSMDENNGFFRIFTVNYNPLSTNIYILDNNLKLIGYLERIAPGETFKGARFIKDKAFLVTYETKDPLFLIDLSDNKPKVISELHIPGYSTYLHPIYFSDNKIKLLGIGQEADQFGTPRNIKIDLYEVDFSKKSFIEKDCSKYSYDDCPSGCKKNPCGSACEPGTNLCIQVCVPKCEGKILKEQVSIEQKDSIILGKEESFGYPNSMTPVLNNPRSFVMKNNMLLIPLVLMEEDPTMTLKATKKPYYVGYKKILIDDKLIDKGGLNIYNILFSLKDKINILPERNNIIDIINYDYGNYSRVVYYGDDIYYFGPDIAVKNLEKALLLE